MSRTPRAHGGATLSDFLAIPEERRFHELIAGEIVEKASPSAEHGTTQLEVGSRLIGPFGREPPSGGPGGWSFMTEVEIRFGEEVCRPDVVSWRRDVVVERPRGKVIEQLPQWICEVLSEDKRNDLVGALGPPAPCVRAGPPPILQQPERLPTTTYPMDQMPDPVRLSLVGATGAVGTQFLQVISHLDLKYSSLDLIASRRSAGKTVMFRGQACPIIAIEDYDFSRCDISFFTAGSKISGEFAPRATAAGCVVVDNTSRFRLDEGIDLIVPQLNGALLQRNRAGSIIANPNCSTIQIVKVLAPIRELFGLRDAVVSTYQAASGAGQKAVDELLAQARSDEPPPRSEYFRAPLAFNVVPVIDELYPSGWTKEELKIVYESRKILQVPDLKITATTVRVPVVTGHSVAMFTRTEKPIDVAALQESFARNREVELCGDDRIPTPRFIAERDKTYVGRIRVDPEDPRGLWTWIVADNLWVGAAYNGGQIIQKLIEQRAAAA